MFLVPSYVSLAVAYFVVHRWPRCWPLVPAAYLWLGLNPTGEDMPLLVEFGLSAVEAVQQIAQLVS
jgi:hypothetical protein